MQNVKESRYLDIPPVNVALCSFSSVFQLLLARTFGLTDLFTRLIISILAVAYIYIYMFPIVSPLYHLITTSIHS
jgi:hypothetical protein